MENVAIVARGQNFIFWEHRLLYQSLVDWIVSWRLVWVGKTDWQNKHTNSLSLAMPNFQIYWAVVLVTV